MSRADSAGNRFRAREPGGHLHPRCAGVIVAGLVFSGSPPAAVDGRARVLDVAAGVDELDVVVACRPVQGGLVVPRVQGMGVRICAGFHEGRHHASGVRSVPGCVGEQVERRARVDHAGCERRGIRQQRPQTVNVALREFAALHRRIAALEHYATLAAGWDFEGWEHRRAAEKDPAA